MDPLLVFGIIVLIVAVVLVAAFVLKRVKMARDPEYAARVNRRKAARELERQQRRMEKAQLRIKRAKYEEAIAPAKSELLKARQDYTARIDRLENELQKLIREHDKAIRDQERVINDIDKKYSQFLAQVARVKLYRDRLVVKDAVIRMNNSIFAELQQGYEIFQYGDRYPEFEFVNKEEEGPRSTPGIMIGGVGLPDSPLPVFVEPDLCYLFVYGMAIERGGERINICIPVDTKSIDMIHSFIQQLNQTAQAAEDTERRRAQELDDAYSQLEAIKADTSQMDKKRAVIERESKDRSGIEIAQRKLAEAEEKAQQEFNYHPG